MREISICEGTIEESDPVKLQSFKTAGGRELHTTPTSLMLGPVRNAQRLERDCKSGEHLKCSIKEFQPLQPANQLHCQSVKCPYANTHSRGNKQKESERESGLHACRVVILLAAWRCGGMASAGMEGYRFFRKDKQGNWEGVSCSMSVACCSAWSSTWG